MPPSLTIATLMSDSGTKWMLNASLTTSNSYRKCSKRRILGHSAQATSPLPTAGTMKCFRIARGSDSGSILASVAEAKAKVSLGFRARDASPDLKTSDIRGVSGSRKAVDVSIRQQTLALGALERRSSWPHEFSWFLVRASFSRSESPTSSIRSGGQTSRHVTPPCKSA